MNAVTHIEDFQAYPFQQVYLNDSARFVIVEGATKIGKTFPFAYKLFKHAARSKYSGRHYWWVAPVSSQARIAYTRLKERLLNLPGARFRESPELQIFLPNGCYIDFKSADKPDSLYGEDVYEVVCDEITRWKKDSWNAVYSTLTATSGTADLIGNFTGSFSWLHLLAEKQIKANNSNWSYHRVPFLAAVQAGLRSMEQYEEAERSLDSLIFKRLYKCEDVEADNQILTNAEIQMFLNHDKAELGKRYISADIAAEGADKFTLWVWDGWRVIDFLVMDKSPSDVVEAKLREYAEKHNIPEDRIAYDADGLGIYLKGYLKRALPFNTRSPPIKVEDEKMGFANLKAQCHYELAMAIKKGRAGIACDLGEHETELAKELAYIRNTMKGTDNKFTLPRKEKDVKPELGHSPDYLEGLAIRAIFELEEPVLGGSTLDY